MPKRIQRKRTKGWRMPPNTVSVCRPGKWGNPFTVKDARQFFSTEAEAQEHAVQKFKHYFGRKAMSMSFDGMRCSKISHDEIKHMLRIGKDIKELAGKDLACWCKLDEPCHADILLEFAN